MVAIVEKKIFASLWLIDFWRSKANFLHSLSIDIPTYYTKLALLCIRNIYQGVMQIMFNLTVLVQNFMFVSYSREFKILRLCMIIVIRSQITQHIFMDWSLLFGSLECKTPKSIGLFNSIIIIIIFLLLSKALFHTYWRTAILWGWSENLLG